jgi:hypothetical protein
MQSSMSSPTPRNYHCLYYSHDFTANTDQHVYQSFRSHLAKLCSEESTEYKTHINCLQQQETYVFLTYPIGGKMIHLYGDKIPSKGKPTLAQASTRLENALAKLLNSSAFVAPEDHVLSLVIPHNVGFKECNVISASAFIAEFNRREIRIGKQCVILKAATLQLETEAASIVREGSGDTTPIVILCYLDFPLALGAPHKLSDREKKRQQADLDELRLTPISESINQSDQFLSGQHFLSTHQQLQPATPKTLRALKTPDLVLGYASPHSYLYRSASGTPMSGRRSSSIMISPVHMPTIVQEKSESELNLSGDYLWQPLPVSGAIAGSEPDQSLPTLIQTPPAISNVRFNISCSVAENSLANQPPNFTDRLQVARLLSVATAVKKSTLSPAESMSLQQTSDSSAISSFNSSPAGPNQLFSYGAELEPSSASSRSSFHSIGNSPDRKPIQHSIGSSPLSGPLSSSEKSPLRALTILVPKDSNATKIRSIKYLQNLSP